MDHLLNHSMCVNNHLQLDGEFDFVQVSGLVLSFLGMLLVGVYILRSVHRLHSRHTILMATTIPHNQGVVWVLKCNKHTQMTLF